MYIVLYEDDFVEVPKEAAEAYAKINTPEYQKTRREVSWMYRCLRIVGIFYGTAPVRIVRRMYRNALGHSTVSREDFIEVFQKVPEEENPCILRDNKIIKKDALENEIYLKVEQRQGDADFYIPEAGEILDYTEKGYPAKDQSYRKLRRFLSETLHLQAEYIEELLKVLWRCISMGAGLSDIMDIFQEQEIIFDTEEALQEFATVIQEVNNNTRMLLHRGHTANEMTDKYLPLTERRMPKIVPAAGTAETVTRVKKIYPNDPCPCGSGKKYKKCCGKNK